MTTTQDYVEGLRAAEFSAISAEPEAQLTIPISNLFRSICVTRGWGTLTLLREAQLDGVRPDFAALIDERMCGWIELKKPGHTVDGPQWIGREKKQWELLAQLDSLIVTDGRVARLYVEGEPLGSDAPLPSEELEWDPEPLAQLLDTFINSRPKTISTVSQLSKRLAPLSVLLRERLTMGLTSQTPSTPIMAARDAWQTSVHEGATDKAFADDCAQVVGYSMAIAALRGSADQNNDGRISLSEVQNALRGPNDLLAAALSPVLGVTGLLDEIRPEIAALERLVSAVDSDKISKSRDSRGEPWLWFYEDFLARYNPAARKEAGVYYTPIAVVDCQVRLLEEILHGTMGKRLGFADGKVTTLDPCAGSGTYPLTVIDHAIRNAIVERDPDAPADMDEIDRAMRSGTSAAAQQAARTLEKNLIAFEMMPGPYAVAHLRIGQRLAESQSAMVPGNAIRVYLTDTLEDPEIALKVPAGLWGDPQTLAVERSRAAAVKKSEEVTVVLGNPPYRRRTAASGGGWVVHNPLGRSLFDDVMESAKDVIFSAQASLYNDYVYFWRWAMWKAFEQNPSAPAAVSFITASSWLNGPAFVGLREMAGKYADEVSVIDLGGEGRGARKDEGVFAIQTPVAVVTMFRKGRSTKKDATIFYRRVEGSRDQKLKVLDGITGPHNSPDEWTELVDLPAGNPMIPRAGGTDWNSMPALTDLLPWQQPGAMYNRAWPISPSSSVLRQRWDKLLSETDHGSRAGLFVTPTTGRTIHTSVGGLKPLSEVLPGTEPRRVVRYGFRSFDRQWTFEDPRLAALERPALWNARSARQIFLTTMTTEPLGRGPALTVTTAPPDKHHFSGRGGKDVIPLFRDETEEQPNITSGLLEMLGDIYQTSVSPHDLAAYVYAVMAHPGYHDRFEIELGTPGPRVPVTANPDLFREAVGFGQEFLWLHTFAERFGEEDSGAYVPKVAGLGWVTEVTTIPATDKEVTYDPATETINVGDGKIAGVREDVWQFAVSGYPVVRRWFGQRTAKGVGRAAGSRATTLDLIRPTKWEDEWNDEALDLLRVLTLTVEAYPRMEELLDRILENELVAADRFPEPTTVERTVPKTPR